MHTYNTTNYKLSSQSEGSQFSMQTYKTTNYKLSSQSSDQISSLESIKSNSKINFEFFENDKNKKNIKKLTLKNTDIIKEVNTYNLNESKNFIKTCELINLSLDPKLYNHRMFNNWHPKRNNYVELK